MRTLVLLLALLLSHSVTADADADAPGEVFAFGDFALYVPAGAPAIRGVLLALGGPDTRAFATGGAFGAPAPALERSLHALGQDLRALAADHALALLGTSLKAPAGLPNDASTDALLTAALAQAARLSGRSELTMVPIFLYGMSGGAPQAAGFSARNPERVGALLLKVPGPLPRLSASAALAVPTYLLLAERDVLVDNALALDTFASHRAAGARWALAVEPGVPHHSLTPGHRAATINWLRTVIALRLDAAPGVLRHVPQAVGWLGEPTHGIASWAKYTGDRNTASWFPSQTTAEEWWQFIGKSVAEPAKAPPAPPRQ